MNVSANAQLANNDINATYLSHNSPTNVDELHDAELTALLNIDKPVPSTLTFELRTPPG